MLSYLKRMIKHKIRYTCQVRKEEGLYAFFMEAAAIEYHVERYCELKQLGGLLDSKGYGIALPKGFLYLNYTMAPSFPLGHQHSIMTTITTTIPIMTSVNSTRLTVHSFNFRWSLSSPRKRHPQVTQDPMVEKAAWRLFNDHCWTR